MSNPTQQDELCLICSDRASGFHYGQLSCEGCKGFFRRSITKDVKYECKYGGNCEIDMYMRRKCQACRLKKCKAVGMRQECVVPEAQCAIKRESKRAQKDKPNSTTRDTPNGNGLRATTAATTTPTMRLFDSATMPPSGQQVPPQPSGLSGVPAGHHHPLSAQQHQQQSSTPLSSHPQNHHLNTNGNQQHLHQNPAATQQTLTPQAPAHISLSTNNHHHQTHLLNSHQNYHMNGASTGVAATTIAGQVPPQTQLSINSNYHSIQAPQHQGVSQHSVQMSNHAVQPQPPSCHNPLNGHFTPTSLTHSSPPNHLAPNSGITSDSLMASNNRLSALQRNQLTSLSPLPSHITSAGDRLNFLNNDLLMNQNLNFDQSLLQQRASEPRLTPEQINIINDLIRYQDEFESPKEEDIRNVPPYNEGQSENQLKHFTEMTILTVKLIVEFAKKVKWFVDLTREDQITLLKASASEVMMLRSTRKYDIKTDSILFANNQPFTRENYRKAHIGEIADAMFNFCRSTVILRLDPAEYALITALIIFSERPNLREPEKVEIIQESYLELLQAYVESREQSEKCKFARLLSLLPELRALGIVNSDVCFSLKVKNHRLPEFLAEIWDVNQEKQDNED